jgi:hypothetical protein
MKLIVIGVRDGGPASARASSMQTRASDTASSRDTVRLLMVMQEFVLQDQGAEFRPFHVGWKIDGRFIRIK